MRMDQKHKRTYRRALNKIKNKNNLVFSVHRIFDTKSLGFDKNWPIFEQNCLNCVVNVNF